MQTQSIRRKIKIENEYLIADIAIEFNLYLKLMPSQRVIKYLNSGRRLSIKQIENLIAKKAEIFIDSAEADKILNYMMHIELNNLVQTAQSTSKDNKAS